VVLLPKRIIYSFKELNKEMNLKTVNLKSYVKCIQSSDNAFIVGNRTISLSSNIL
jgi:hypothetical protein